MVIIARCIGRIRVTSASGGVLLLLLRRAGKVMPCGEWVLRWASCGVLLCVRECAVA